jgi:putative addiction module component (TIGR02574 family)
MNPILDQLKASAAELSRPERAELAHYLIESLEPEDEEASEAWADELQRRLDDIQAGRVTGKPVEEVLARLREKYP